MDIVALTYAITTVLTPVMPYLFKAGEKAADEAGKKVADKTWESAKEIWAKLWPSVEAKAAALEAAQDVAQTPDDGDAQAALRRQLKKLLAEDDVLAKEIAQLWENSKGRGVTVSASGERSVAIGGNLTGSSIITGDVARPDKRDEPDKV